MNCKALSPPHHLEHLECWHVERALHSLHMTLKLHGSHADGLIFDFINSSGLMTLFSTALVEVC